jgi:hypothetical protein
MCQDEFRRHRSTDNPLHIIGFLSQWKIYLDSLEVEHGTGEGKVGKKLNPETLEKVIVSNRVVGPALCLLLSGSSPS